MSKEKRVPDSCREIERLTRKNVGLIAIISKLEANIKYRRDENRKLRRNESQLRKVLAAKYVALAAYEEQATTLTRENERLTRELEAKQREVELLAGCAETIQDLLTSTQRELAAKDRVTDVILRAWDDWYDGPETMISSDLIEAIVNLAALKGVKSDDMP